VARSLSLPFLRVLRRPAQGQTAEVPEQARPSGPLVWVQLPRWSEINVMDAIAERLEAEGIEPTFLLTAPGPPPEYDGFHALFLLRSEPEDADDPAIAFLAHWRPDLILWIAGRFLPKILAATDPLGVPRYLLDANGTGAIEGTAGPWLAARRREQFARFDRILCTSETARSQLIRLKIDPEKLEETGALSRDSGTLPCNEADRVEMAEVLTNRPVWLAACAPMDEMAMIITAYRLACRRSHRLLLILMPADLKDGEKIANSLNSDGFHTALRTAGDLPVEEVQILIADQEGELGLWYRMAPISYLGGTMKGNNSPDPLGAAALGSAIVHGPGKAPYQESYRLLKAANAAREVRNATELGAELQILLSPDKAARMAHAGWEVISAGAAATERTIALIRARLIQLGV